jgi:predicted RNA-binding protein YlxR (DUF448 family)
MMAAARNSNRETAERRCIVTGASAERGGLVRFVRGPGDAVVVDLAEKLPGRGVWVSADRSTLEKGIGKNVFSRAFKATAHVDAGLAADVADGLARRCLNYLGLAARAGEAVAGYEKVRGRIKAGEAGVVIAARDGSADGRGKIEAISGSTPVIDLFDSRELSLALGRENVVHAALRPGGLADKFLSETARLAGFRTESVTG